MASSPNPPPTGNSPEFNRTLIEKEIAHLKKKGSTRHLGDSRRFFSRSVMVLAILALVWFYAMDPFLYAYYRGEAIHTYLYLHNYGSEAKATALENTGILSTYEAAQLGKRQGSFQDYYRNSADAEKKAADIIGYMQGVHNLHEGVYAQLTPTNKARYLIFIKNGLATPTEWDFLNPSIGQ